MGKTPVSIGVFPQQRPDPTRDCLRDFPYLEKEDFQAVYAFFAMPEILVDEAWK